MDVSCTRCGAEYEFEETLVSSRGTTVKCTNCGHLFKVFRPGTSPDDARPWLIRKSDGMVEPLGSLGDLTRLIAQGTYTPNDEISRTGQAWKRLGDIAELQGFFPASRGSERRERPRPPTPPEGFKALAPKPQAAVPPTETGPKDAERPRRDSPGAMAVEPAKAQGPDMRRDGLAAAGGAPGEENRGPELLDPARAQSPKIPPQAGEDARIFKGPAVKELISDEPTSPTAIDRAIAGSDEYRPRDSDARTTTKMPRLQLESTPVSIKPEPRTDIKARLGWVETTAPPPAKGETTAIASRPPAKIKPASAPAPSILQKLGWLIAGIVLAGAARFVWDRFPEARTILGLEDAAAKYLRRANSAIESYRFDRFQESATEYTKALAFRERDPRILSSLSRTYAQWAQALKFRAKDLQNAAAADVERRDLRAAAVIAAADYARLARKYADQAVRYEPDNPEASIALSDAMRLAGDLGAARSTLDHTRGKKGVPEADLLQVEALLAIDEAGGDLKAGLDYAERAASRFPRLISARILLARILIAADRRYEALQNLNAVLALDRTHPIALSLLDATKPPPPPEPSASATAPTRPAEQSRGGIDNSSTGEAGPKPGLATPDEPFGRYLQQGEILLDRGSVLDADKAFTKALEIHPNEPRALVGLGYVELERNQPNRAIDHFNRAARKGYLEAFVGLGDSYRQLKRDSDALQAYQKYVKLSPHGSLISIARRQIEQLKQERPKEGAENR